MDPLGIRISLNIIRSKHPMFTIRSNDPTHFSTHCRNSLFGGWGKRGGGVDEYRGGGEGESDGC